MKTTKNLCNHFTFSNEEVEYQIKKNSKEVNGMLSKKYYQDYVMPEDELNYHIKEDLLRCSLQSFELKEEVVNSFEEINSIRESIVNDIESSIEKLSMKIASKKAINKYYRDYEMPEDELNYYVRRDLVRDCLSTRKYHNDLLQEEVKDEKNYRTLVNLLSNQYELDEEHIMANTEYRRYKGYVTSFYTAKIDINKKGKINHTNGRYETSLKDAEMICIQESNMTLKLALQGFMQDVFVLKLKYDSSKEDELEIYDTMAEDIIAEGLYIDGKKYRILTQTAAQGRTGKFYIAPANKIHKYRVALSNGVDYTGQKKVLGKLEKRISLGLSSGYILGRRDKKGNIISYYDYDVKYIDDVKKELDIKLILPIEEQVDGVWHFVGKENLLLDLNTCKTKEEYKKYYEYFKPEVTDGFGLIDIRTACKWAYELGCINKKQMVYFMENFVSFDEVLNNDLMKYILDNIPTAYQVRHQWDKGLLVIWDLRAEGIEAEILMNNSMHKEKEEAVTDSTWRICNYNKPKGNFNYLSYQSLQKLGLSDDLLKKLGDNTIAFLTKCLKDPKCALEFLNIHDQDIEFVGGSDKKIQSKLIEILTKNPKAIYSDYVQNKMLDLIEKQIHLTLIGKVIIPGAYYYMCPDPRVMFGRDTLQSGENYFNGMEGDLGLVRYPCVNFLEPQKLNFKDDKELWFLKDLVVFNPFDGRWLGMGGADFDGDICLVIKDKEVVEQMRSYDFIVNIITHNYAKAEEVNEENLIEMYKRSYKGSEVGILSDYVTKFISRAENESGGKRITRIKGTKKFSPLNDIIKWTFVIGKEIDKAKTYEDFAIPEYLIEYAKKYNPDWMIAKNMFKKKIYDFNLDNLLNDKVTISNCSMGRYFRYMKSKYNLLTGRGEWKKNLNFSNEKEFISMLMKVVNMDGDIKSIIDDVREIYDDYTTHMGILVKKEFDDADIRNKIYSAVFDDYRERFEVLCRDKNYDRYTAAFVCAYIPYSIDVNKLGKTYTNKEGKVCKYGKRSKAFAFNIAYDYLLDILSVSNNGKITVKIPTTLKDTITVLDGYMNIDGFLYETRLEDGIYNVRNNGKGSYVDVSLTDVNPRLENNTMTQEELDALRDRVNNAGKEFNGYNQIEGFEDRFRFTVVNTKAYKTNPKEVISSLVGNEFIVSKDREYFTLISIENNKANVLCNIKGVLDDVVGMKFTVREDVLDKCNFYNQNSNKNSRYYEDGNIVKEAVSFGADFVSEASKEELELLNINIEDEKAILTDGIRDNYDYDYDEDDYDVTDYDYDDYEANDDYDFDDSDVDYDDFDDSEFDDSDMDDNYYDDMDIDDSDYYDDDEF